MKKIFIWIASKLNKCIDTLVAVMRILLKWSFIAVIVGYGLLVTYWLLWPYNVIDVHSIIIQNPGKQVKQGGTLIYKIDYTKFDDVVGVVSRRLINDFTIIYSNIPGMGRARSRVLSVSLPIPDYAQPGKYKLMWTVTYPVNPMRAISETAWSDEFEVIPGDSFPNPVKQKEEKEQTFYQPNDGKQKNHFDAKNPCQVGG